MGVCHLCREKTGWFQDTHLACVERATVARGQAEVVVGKGVLEGKAYLDLEAEVNAIAAETKFSFETLREAVVQAADSAASQLAVKSPLPEVELTRLVRILQGFGVQSFEAELAQRRWFGMALVGMSHILWQVLHDIAPYFDESGRMQFNLQSGEVPIIASGKVTFAEERSVSIHTRGHGGLSIPVGGGCYYHLGLTQGQTERVSGLQAIDVGEMLITNQALYFGGQQKTLRMSLKDVIRYQPYVDAVGVCESGSPRVFVPDYRGMDTGWFFYNLLTALTSKLTQ